MKELVPRAVIGVMGSSRLAHSKRSRRIGEWLARSGYHLLTGGGPGVMAAVSEAFVGVIPRAGCSIGILPSALDDPTGAPLGYPNPWVEIAIRTHLDRHELAGDHRTSRNHLNVLSSDVLIVLPGAAGTASEARLAIRYGRPCIAYLDNRLDVPGLPSIVRVEPKFEDVQCFVREVCTA